METSDENNLLQLPISPPRRRRSTFFVRRDSLAAEPHAQSTSSNTQICEQNQELLQYYNVLQKEKQQWKEEVNRRRNDYHELREQFKIAKNNACRPEMCYSALTVEDIKFLNQRLNLSKLIESQQALHESVKVTQAFYRKAMELDDEVLKICEDNINRIKDYILDNSTIEPLEKD